MKKRRSRKSVDLILMRRSLRCQTEPHLQMDYKSLNFRTEVDLTKKRSIILVIGGVSPTTASAWRKRKWSSASSHIAWRSLMGIPHQVRRLYIVIADQITFRHGHFEWKRWIWVKKIWEGISNSWCTPILVNWREKLVNQCLSIMYFLVLNFDKFTLSVHIVPTNFICSCHF